MTAKTTGFLLLLVAAPVTAQQERELLLEVDRDQAQRLEEYNSVSLQEELYFASRHRIVRADIDVLLEGRDIIVTPFADVVPIKLVHERLDRQGDDAVFWRGHVRFPENDELFKTAGVGIPAWISMFGWHLDEEGNAHSMGTLVNLESDARPQHLERNAFYSADAVLQAPPSGTQYVLRPLKYTPRYSVIYEISPDTLIPIRIDDTPGQPDNRTEYEKELLRRYRDFIASLPKEENKAIRGDIQ
ncbi:MAG TPA: hypothetical protein VIC71_02855 [Gammaproteobacteria bacterium]|jgi:hypothetical protein